MRYWPVLLLALIVSLGLFLPRASGEGLGLPLKWNVVEAPGRRGGIIIPNSEVSRIAVGRGVVYAIDSRVGGVYRSESGGSTWSEITANLASAGVALPAQEVAVCPDRPTIVAVVDNNRKKVYVSKDSGATWEDTNLTISATAEIRCLALSTYRMSGDEVICDIAVGTRDGGNGKVYVRSTSAFSSWQDQGLSQGDVWAIKFSLTYSLQAAIAAVTADGADTWLSIGSRDIANNSTQWNATAGLVGYPQQVEDGGDSPDKNQLLGADLDMPADFNLVQPCVYVSTDSTTLGLQVGIYRIEGVAATVTYFSGSYGRIYSIAHYGKKQQGRLVAGEVTGAGFQVKVWWTDSAYPGYGLPATLRQATQPPTGPGNAFVRWSYDGTVAYCGTSGTSANDESAFSSSFDFGGTWQQLSLIDTTINISDIAPAPDSKSLFLASYTEHGPEGVWRSAGEPLGQYWGRVLSLDTTTDRVILRQSPNYLEDYTIYAVEVGDTGTPYNKMAVSNNRGNFWQHRPVPGPVIDFAVEDRDSFYVALPYGRVRKDTTAGATWVRPAVGCFPRSVSEINMLSIPCPGHLLVGSRDGRVAYSTDGGESFTEIEPVVGNDPSRVGDVQVVADARYAANGIIYASDNISDKGIWRWTIGVSREWEQIDKVVTDLGAGRCVVGLAVGQEGTLYAASSENVTCYSGGMGRSLNPGHGELSQIEWDILNRTLPTGAAFNPLAVFHHNLPHLKISDEGGRNVLWAVDTANRLIYAFEDNICRSGPVVVPTGEIGCDAVSGRAQEVDFCWEQLSLADAYDIEIAKDSDFSIKIVDQAGEHAWEGFLFPVDVTRPCVFFPAGGRAAALSYVARSDEAKKALVTTMAEGSAIGRYGQLECGHSYYWRVRVRHAATTETIRSPWSEVKSFTVKTGLPVNSSYCGVQLLAPKNGAVGYPVSSVPFSWAPQPGVTRYEFLLAEDMDFNKVVAHVTTVSTVYTYEGWLKYQATYFWRVRPLEVGAQTSPGDWSPTFCFQTETIELPAVPAVVPSGVPLWAWVVIALGSVLIAVTVGLLFLC